LTDETTSRDPSTGQFTEAPPLTGREGVEAAQGYVPLDLGDKEPEQPTITTDQLLAGDLKPFTENDADSALSMPESEIKRYGTALDDLPDNVSITLEQAAQITSEEKAAEAKAAEEAELAKVREETDRLRGITPEQANEQSAELKAYLDAGVQPDVAEALLKPQVRAALEGEFQRADEVKQQYSAAIQQAQTFAQAAFFEAVPELAGLPVEQVEAGIEWLRVNAPERFSHALGTLQRVASLQQAQSEQQQHQAQIYQQQFEAYAKAEDQAFNSKLEPGEEESLRKNLRPYLQKKGIDPEQFAHALQTNPMMRSAQAQRLIADAIAYDQIRNAPKPAKFTPRVSRPGVAGVRTPGGDQSSSIRALEAQLSTASGDAAARISAKIYGLQKRSGR